MQLSDFNYHLPPELIAQRPLAERSQARLLVLADASLEDRQVSSLPDLLSPGDLLVVNDTRVVPARLFGQRPSGGKIQVMVERVLDAQRFLAQLAFSRAPKVGEVLTVEGAPVRVLAHDGAFFELTLEHTDETVLAFLERCGKLPLPPYIRHAPDADDAVRYQTVFASVPGAVAAPTASLHFDAALLKALDVRGVRRATVTLHVGAGTFQPVRVTDLREHRMHAESYEIPQSTRDAIDQTRRAGGKVVAVGTTVCRALESAADEDGLPRIEQRDTHLFITPGYRFRVVDRMLTNFHLPESTLLMLVSAFAGHTRIRSAYAHAIAQRYRFFSYGDAMLLSRTA
ncbi:tRNA preQ1(34) S-adenosylmethionine ribosyltransferase-isomerase QueA [Polycyclovorans algicola]|uniref:tRNA preQ1(34) S-adenosylmethionine ribosyltransferase-isomerase QueA n=1 Tax=Polycyclovorans algicola TaxID=616992 RepID=UPI0004A70171|nr:tRNA preQ1(34) S-adenosylmethionine ribosyltransferase-isomerase QueA [Polycyclovorans algicola]